VESSGGSPLDTGEEEAPREEAPKERLLDSRWRLAASLPTRPALSRGDVRPSEAYGGGQQSGRMARRGIRSAEARARHQPRAMAYGGKWTFDVAVETNA